MMLSLVLSFNTADIHISNGLGVYVCIYIFTYAHIHIHMYSDAHEHAQFAPMCPHGTNPHLQALQRHKIVTTECTGSYDPSIEVRDGKGRIWKNMGGVTEDLTEYSVESVHI